MSLNSVDVEQQLESLTIDELESCLDRLHEYLEGLSDNSNSVNEATNIRVSLFDYVSPPRNGLKKRLEPSYTALPAAFQARLDDSTLTASRQGLRDLFRNLNHPRMERQRAILLDYYGQDVIASMVAIITSAKRSNAQSHITSSIEAHPQARVIETPIQVPLVTQARPNTKKITLFSRNRDHQQYLIDHDIPKQPTAQHLEAWLKDFYCGRYLTKDASSRAKAAKIVERMEQQPLAEPNETVKNYLQRTGLAPLIGQHRISTNENKNPWGLEKIERDFGYQPQASDIKPKLSGSTCSRRL